jgi:hypothetical protein
LYEEEGKIMNKKIDGLIVYKKIMDAALSMPGARINREDFLRKELAPYFSYEEINNAIKTSVMAIDRVILDKIASGSLKHHVMISTGLSFVSGLPGGWWMAATIPSDIAQFFYNAIQLAQKIAYTYGWPELSGDATNDELSMEIAIFLGVMMGSASAVSLMTKFANELAINIAKRLPKVALTKYAFYNTLKQVARWIGVSITKASFGKAVGDFIPILGGFVSGSITLILMSLWGGRLIKHLQKNPFNPLHFEPNINN